MKKSLKKVCFGMLAATVCVTTAAVGVSRIGKIHKTTTVEESVNATNGIVMHFKWTGKSTPHLFYSNINNTGETNMSYPGIPMNEEGNDWYTYSISDADSADIVISVPDMGYETNSFGRVSGEYWYDDGRGWFTENPDKDIMTADKKLNTAKNDGLVSVNTDAGQVAAEEGITIHFISDWDKASVYYWNAIPDDMETSWPGENMSKDEDGYYTYTFQGVNKINLLFTNGSKQTEDLTVKSGEWWYDGKKWSKKKPNNESVDPIPFERTDFRDETIYFLMTTRFYDGDSSNNAYCDHDFEQPGNDKNNDPAWRGDFEGLIEKLDYIKALGFSAIWITPVVENRSGYDFHGYHAYDFTKVDERYKSAEDADGMSAYQKLINACHEKGIKVVQDVVLNHTCNWGERNLLDLSGEDDWKVRNEVVMNGKGDPDNIYHHNQFLDSGGFDQYWCQTGSIAGDCYDLETENPTVYNYLNDVYTSYINMGVDAFRIDTVKHISRLTFNKEFIPAFKKAGGENFFMFGEVCVRNNSIFPGGLPGLSVPFYTWTENQDYAWGDLTTNEASVDKNFKDNNEGNQRKSDNAILKGNEYHKPDHSENSGLGVIDFYMHWGFESAGNAFGRGLQEDEYFNDSTYNVMYVDSHDYGPDTNKRYDKGTAAWAENMDLMWTFRGIPCIYYGSEIEFKAGKSTDDYFDALENTGRAYFGDHIEGSVNTTDYGVYSGETGAMAESLNYPLAKHVQRLNLIRRAVPALRKGQYSTEGVEGGIAYKRRYTEGSTDSFVCVTISGDATFSGVPSGTYVDMVTGDVQECSGTLKASCSGQGNMRVYVLQTDGAPSGKIGEDGTYLK